MTAPSPNSVPPHWQTGQSAGQPQPSTPITRFLGGSPIGVFFRLLVLSLLVGAFLMWADIRPAEVWRSALHLVDMLWSMGFGAIQAMGDYILAGAIIVVPLWLVIRLLTMRGDDR